MTRKPLGEHSDEQLMDRAKVDDHDAFGVIYTRHRGVAFAIALRMAGPAAADDVVQLAFLTAWRGRSSYDEARGAPRGWILAIVRNRAIDALRRDSSYARLLRSQERALSGPLPEIPREQPDGWAMARDEARLAREALALLPAPQRRALELAYFQGLTHEQIAAREATPLGTVKSRLRLGLEKLHRQLGDPVVSSASSSSGRPDPASAG